jgi:hypothetical protein
MTIKQRTKNMNKLIKFMRKHPHSFDMAWIGSVKRKSNYGVVWDIIPTANLHGVISNNTCGSACCIIGYTQAISYVESRFMENESVSKFLGIDSEIANQLCYPSEQSRFYPELSYRTTDVEVAIKFIKQVCEEQNDLQRVRSANRRRA